jgi:hypothetical protein
MSVTTRFSSTISAVINLDTLVVYLVRGISGEEEHTECNLVAKS